MEEGKEEKEEVVVEEEDEASAPEPDDSTPCPVCCEYLSAHEMHHSARQSVPRSLPRSPGERCQSTRCCSGSRAARVSATRGAVGQFSRFGVPICTSYTLVDLTPKYLALVSLLTPGRHARVAAHRPPSTLSTVRGTPRPYGFLYASLPGNACHGCRCWRLEVVVFGHEAERHVGSVMRYRVRGGSARRKRAGASRWATLRSDPSRGVP